ncbi:MAG: DUF2178 domain-containing protein [bacterium]|nr:DUF2178 domain-containing protein [bacterium]
MSLWQKRAVFAAVLWSIVATAFLISSCLDDGPRGMVNDEPRRNAAACFLAFGIITHLVVSWITRDRRDSPCVLVDERDKIIAQRASQVAFTFTAIVAFLACLILDEVFETPGLVPVGWVWFLGYSAWIFPFLLQALVSVVLYTRTASHAEG